MALKIIAAVSSNGVIGANNTLPWQGEFKEDMKHFRQMTSGQDVIMGNGTFRSMGNRLLPKRHNIIVSKSSGLMIEKVPDATICTSYETAFEISPDAWIIGGASAYQAGLNVASELYLTLIPRVITGDNLVYFPFVNPQVFELKETIAITSELSCIVYRRM